MELQDSHSSTAFRERKIMPPQSLPILVTIAAASAWGLFWLPLRAFETLGLSAGWATLGVFATPAFLLIVPALIRRVHGHASGVRNASAGLLVGGAVALYSESVLLTDVARALILFYVTPVWSTLLEKVFFKRTLSAARIMALALGLTGLLTILGGRTGVPLPQNPGDALALLAGVVWACGTVRVRMLPDSDVFETVFSFFLYGSLVAFLINLLPLDAHSPAPTWAELRGVALWLVLAALGFMIPVMTGLLWGSQRMEASRLGIILQLEAVVGITSAAWLTDEPFGLFEALGAALVLGAGLVDILGDRALATSSHGVKS